jgi:hypothetical protein
VKEGSLKEARQEPEPAATPPPKKEAPPPPPPPAPKKVEKVEPERPPRVVEPEPAPSGEPVSSGNAAVRGIGYALLALGMAGLVAGTVMGVLWRNTVGLINGATVENGVITSIGGRTDALQPYYMGLQDRARVQAISADALWAGGGVLAITGIILYFVGRENADVAMGMGGVAWRW